MGNFLEISLKMEMVMQPRYQFNFSCWWIMIACYLFRTWKTCEIHWIFRSLWPPFCHARISFISQTRIPPKIIFVYSELFVNNGFCHQLHSAFHFSLVKYYSKMCTDTKCVVEIRLRQRTSAISIVWISNYKTIRSP